VNQAGKDIPIYWTAGDHAILGSTALRRVLALRSAALGIRHFSQSSKKQTAVWLPHPSTMPDGAIGLPTLHWGLLDLRVNAPNTL
jgi:hypothetical protein